MFEIVHTYTRTEAIEDGVLVDITSYCAQGETKPLLKQAGIKLPVAVTRAVYDSCIGLPEGYTGIQDVTGRMWDILMCLRQTILTHPKASGVRFTVSVRLIDGERDTATVHEYRLAAVLSPDEHGAPVITVMFPEED